MDHTGSPDEAASQSALKRRWWFSVPLYTAAATVIAFPIFWGGKQMAAVSAVEVSVYALALAIALSSLKREVAPLRSMQIPAAVPALAVCGALFAAVAFLQTVTLPAGILSFLSPGAAEIYTSSGAPAGAISLNSSLTWQSAFWFGALLLVWFWCSSLPAVVYRHPRDLKRASRTIAEKEPLIRRAAETDYAVEILERAVVIAGLLCSLIALTHWGLRLELLFGFFDSGRILTDHTRAHWPFVNPDHLSVLLEMSIMIGFSKLLRLVHLSNLRKGPRNRNTAQSAMESLAHPERLGRRLKWLIALFVMLLANVFAMSRAGNALVFGGGLALWILHRRLSAAPGLVSTERAAYRAGSWAGAALLLAGILFFMGEAGRDLAANRIEYGLTSSTQDIRWAMVADTLSMFSHYPLFGVGLGCWGVAITRFMGEDLAGFGLDYAHNDPAQLLAETGFIGFVIALAALFAVIRYARFLFRTSMLPTHKVQAYGAGLALVLPLVHSLVDFPFHIPAVAYTFAIVLALFLRCSLISRTEEVRD